MGCSVIIPDRCCNAASECCSNPAAPNVYGDLSDRQYRKNLRKFQCHRRKKTLQMIRQISDTLVKNEARKKGLIGESSLYLLSRKQPALLVVPDVDRRPNVIAFNTLEPLRGDRTARSEVLVRRLGFIFAAVREGETPGLVGIS